MEFSENEIQGLINNMWLTLKGDLDTLYFFSEKEIPKDKLVKFRDLAEKATELITKYNLPIRTKY